MLDKKIKTKISKIFVPATILYSIFIFYLSVTSSVDNIKSLLDATIGHAVREILIVSHLSFILNFLNMLINFAERQSIDPGHVGIYFGLGALLYFLYLSSRSETLEKYAVAFAIFTGTAYGVLNEIFQMYLPYRVPSVADALSNLIGLVLAQICVLIFVLLLREIQNKRKRSGEVAN